MDFNNSSDFPNMSSWPPHPNPMPQYDRQAWERHRMQLFWQKQLINIQTAEAFKRELQLPLARIRRIMKSEGEAKLLSAEAPLLMSKACEIFIQELAVRAWMRAEEANKRTVESCDVAKAIVETDVFDFLTDILPPELIEPYTQNAQEGNAVEGANQVALPSAGFMGNLMMNTGSQEGNAVNIAAENHVPLPYGADFMGNPMMYTGSEGNAIGGNQTALPYNAGFMGNPMMNTGNEGNAVNYVEGSQAVMPYNAGFMGNPMISTGNEGNALTMAGGNQAALPSGAGFMGNPMMNMGSDLVARNQQFPQPYVMKPQFVPSDQFPYNFHPK